MSSKIGRGKKTLISAFAQIFTIFTKTDLLEGTLDTGLVPT